MLGQSVDIRLRFLILPAFDVVVQKKHLMLQVVLEDVQAALLFLPELQPVAGELDLKLQRVLPLLTREQGQLPAQRGEDSKVHDREEQEEHDQLGDLPRTLQYDLGIEGVDEDGEVKHHRQKGVGEPALFRLPLQAEVRLADVFYQQAFHQQRQKQPDEEHGRAGVSQQAVQQAAEDHNDQHQRVHQTEGEQKPRAPVLRHKEKQKKAGQNTDQHHHPARCLNPVEVDDQQHHGHGRDVEGDEGGVGLGPGEPALIQHHKHDEAMGQKDDDGQIPQDFRHHA